MNLMIDEKDGQLHVELSGRLDTITAPEFLQTVEEAFSPEKPWIIADCKDLEYISSSGLRSCMYLYKKASRYGGRLTMLNLTPQVREVLRMTGLYPVFSGEQTGVEPGQSDSNPK